MILCVWGPLQYLVNARCTKISAHVGVITGILTTFLVLGDLNRVPLVIGAVAIILATAWARVVTGHHTLLQVSLGAGVSVVAVLLTWSLMTVW
jgi:membrane-associated phospholipid phosphatase